MANTLHSSLTGINLHYSKLQIITGSPAFIPTYIGQTVYDILNNVLYVANGVSSLANWQASSPVRFNSQTGTTYTVTNTDNFGVVSLTNAAARAITLPASPINGFNVTIKDEAGTAYTANITITASGLDIFLGGGSTLVLSSEYESVTLYYDLSNSTWTIV